MKVDEPREYGFRFKALGNEPTYPNAGPRAGKSHRWKQFYTGTEAEAEAKARELTGKDPTFRFELISRRSCISRWKFERLIQPGWI